MKIFVAGLPYDMDDAELEEFFEKFGKVASVKVAMDRDTGKSKGFGFVDMPNAEEAKEAIDGLDGFNKVTGEEFNLVICDVNMPNLDGLSFVQKVRSDEKARFVPIIMLTTESQEDKKRKGLEAGAKAWLVKPFSPDQLLNAISKLIV